MKTLATSQRIGGYDLSQIKRVEDVALFEKKGGAFTSYEVVIVQRHNGFVIAGNVVPPGESMPSTSQWGKSGWTCRTLTEAATKFDVVLKAERERAAKGAL